MPLHGVSLAYTFDSNAPTRKQSQHFEIVGDRAIWERGWKAVARHPKGTDFDADQWELYHLDRDFAEFHDLAAEQPDRLHKLIDLWWSEAGKYGVLPLDDRDWERVTEHFKMNPRTRYEYLGNMARIDRLAAPDITDRSYVVTATFDSDEDTEGVILAWGSLFGGFVIYVNDGQLSYEYVYSESLKHTMCVGFPQRAGKRTIQLNFERTASYAGRASLTIDGAAAGVVDIPRTWPIHGTTAGLNCGLDAGAPVSDAYERSFPFTGRCLRLTVQLENDLDRDSTDAYRAVLKEQ
jgi:arylsulfatase